MIKMTPFKYCLELFSPISNELKAIYIDDVVIFPDGKFVVIVNTKEQYFIIPGVTSRTGVALTYDNLKFYKVLYDKLERC